MQGVGSVQASMCHTQLSVVASKYFFTILLFYHIINKLFLGVIAESKLLSK